MVDFYLIPSSNDGEELDQISTHTHTRTVFPQFIRIKLAQLLLPLIMTLIYGHTQNEKKKSKSGESFHSIQMYGL